MTAEILRTFRISLLAIVALIPATAHAQQRDVQDDGTFVIDTAEVFTAEQQQKLEVWLKELETKTETQLKVLSIDTTGGEDIFEFAQRTASQWKLGRRREDDGALIVLAVSDRNVRIQTGYGIEPILPDSWCGTQSREVAQTYFRQQQYAEGLTELALRAANRIAKAKGVDLSGVPQPDRIAEEAEISIAAVILLVIVLIILVYLASRYRGPPSRGRSVSRRSDGWWVVPTSTWNSGGRSYGGGGFGGGSFGGGGRFGGGGGGASW